MLTIKKRTDFLRARSGRKWHTGTLTLQARPSSSDQKKSVRSDRREARTGYKGLPRFGFTITKKIGSSVIRNRIKRRVKEAVRLEGMDYSKAGYDYVVIARRAALNCPFNDILKDLHKAMNKVHEQNRDEIRG